MTFPRATVPLALVPIRLPASILPVPAWYRLHAGEDVARDQVARAGARSRGQSADRVAGSAVVIVMPPLANA